MKINIAHLREKSTSGGWIDFAVFDARSNSGTTAANQLLLNQLTEKARGAGFKIDQSALAFMSSGKATFFGSQNLVGYLSKQGVPRWTHSLEV